MRETLAVEYGCVTTVTLQNLILSYHYRKLESTIMHFIFRSRNIALPCCVVVANIIQFIRRDFEVLVLLVHSF